MRQTEIQITYNLQSVDLVNKIGVLKVKQAHLSKGKTIQVTLSGQLIYKIKEQMKNPKARKYLMVDYTSTLMSPKFEENPFKLVKFIKEGEDDSFKLQLVTDKGHYFKEYTNAMNQRVDKIMYKHWKTTEFMRFWTVDLNNAK